ncbi:hypothetical protein AGR5A_pa30181 [Agrobacterium genomosp. 5 str. CFBP 6626]|nr:hypothetical protein AGR5A_pa30181 [Agrobacterium genomosp. 5 str. CFBP 6626]
MGACTPAINGRGLIATKSRNAAWQLPARLKRVIGPGLSDDLHHGMGARVNDHTLVINHRVCSLLGTGVNTTVSGTGLPTTISWLTVTGAGAGCS